VILAGGAASRFGGKPKGLEPVGGERIIDRLVTAFESALGARPLLVANDPAAATWRPDLAVVPDRSPGLGALGGIWTAVSAGPAPVVLVAWDMPFVSAALIRVLAEGLEGHDACLPASGGRRGVEPLCAAYGPGCEPAIGRALERGDHRAIGFHHEVRVHIIPVEELAPLGDPDQLFFNVNTLDDLTLANGQA
jgi:molybdopterin-guanine dinucleotide biosynthesis protein A